MRFLLDTNVVSELRKKKPHGAVMAWFALVQDEDVAVPATVFGELQAGVEITRKQDTTKAAELEAWIDEIALASAAIAIDAAIAREWARLMTGKSDNLSGDAMIAATARIHNLTVVTRNTKDFETFGVDLFNPFTHKSSAKP